MGDSIAEQFSALSLSNRIDRIKSLIVSDPQEIEIIPPGKLCRADGFFDGLADETLVFIYKIEHGGRSPFRAEFLSRASQDALLRAINFNEPSSLRRAVVYGALAVYHVLSDDPERGKVISMFGRAVRRRWEVSKLDEDLDEEIFYFQKAVQHGPLEEPNRALHFDDLGEALIVRYSKTHVFADFEEGKRSLEAAIDLGHSGEPMFICGLGKLAKERSLFEKPNEATGLDECISIFSNAITKVTSEFRGSVAVLHWNVGKAYEDRYKLSSSAEDWEKARAALEKSLSLLTPGSSNHLISCYDLAMLHSVHFNQLGQLTDGDKATELFKLALQSNPAQAQVMAALAENLRLRAKCTRSEQDLEESLKIGEKSVQLSSPEDSESPFRLGRQAHALVDRFEFNGKVEDIDQAIALLWKTMEHPMLNDTDRWKFLQMIGTSFLMRYEVSQDSEDLDNALSAIQAALTTDNLAALNKAACLRELGRILFKQYKLTKEKKNLDEAIEAYQDAIKTYGSDSPSLYLVYNDLGNAMSLKFETSSAYEDLREALKKYNKGIESVHRCRGEKNYDAEAMLLHGLANVQFQQFHTWKRSSDLDIAIACYRKCVESTQETNIKLAGRAGSLSWALQARFDLHQNFEDLKEAQLQIENVMKLPLKIKATTKAYLENRLGAAQLRSFYVLEELQFLDAAAEHFNKALNAGCKEPAFNFSAAVNLGTALMRKAEVTKNQGDMLNATTQFYRAMQLLKPNDPDFSNMLSIFADFLMSVYTMTSLPLAAEGYLKISHFVIQNKNILPETVAYTKMQAARLQYEINHNAALARDNLISATKDLPEAILLGLNRSDQLRIVRRFSWLPSHAAAFSLAAGDTPEVALRLFESSRSIIWDRLLNENANINSLEEEHPVLASRFTELKTQLARQVPVRAATDPVYASVLSRQTFHNAALSYNAALKEIRAQPGFENFLLLPDGSYNLLEYAADGPIIVINGTEQRSDAIIVRSNGVIALPLPNFTHDACLEKAGELHVALTSMGGDFENASQIFDKVMLWLWTSVAEPVLRELGFLGRTEGNSSQNKLPHVWWMTTGWLNIFPIHAAGDHKKAVTTEDPCTVMDSTFSSYINTLKALDWVRKNFASLRSTQRERKSAEALVVQMPTTPDSIPLKNAATEASSVHTLLKDAHIQTEILDRPKRAGVLSRLKSCTVAHFACHGISDPTDPSLSHLKLQDWKPRPLDVRALLRNHKPAACQLVYLSACETAASKAVPLREEGIHLSGGFQMAGVPHVIATLWRVEDSLSVDVAEGFYAGLEREGSLEIDRAAEALRTALVAVRERGVDALLWGAYVHSGP